MITRVLATGPFVHHILFPFRMYPPSVLSARHFMLTTSDPAVPPHTHPPKQKQAPIGILSVAQDTLCNAIWLWKSEFWAYGFNFYSLGKIEYIQFGSLIARAPTCSPLINCNKSKFPSHPNHHPMRPPCNRWEKSHYIKDWWLMVTVMGITQ
jgi:hypothetical protein